MLTKLTYQAFGSHTSRFHSTITLQIKRSIVLLTCRRLDNMRNGSNSIPAPIFFSSNEYVSCVTYDAGEGWTVKRVIQGFEGCNAIENCTCILDLQRNVSNLMNKKQVLENIRQSYGYYPVEGLENLLIIAQ